ncbi:hypothetical protein XENTR_v10009180 [Xenopus tropicalis]|uniref:BCL2 like 10 n=1 Tax=Xenopus tropicalis TaxID=8364 RepID=A0A6I8RJ04_XENTR|nr:bcl-2-like protein 10 [Xenopus tropicalis]KAE8617720.1 hypothetical protein XENTR_v10009180 [Xenopus tropicalis]KAE8617721.1 hypothetical protein XENTR_v10009180 [Xenopus tropicalis]|eukprot:XP_017947918.1 PREDICTED: bcl-2-like protein 10 [Xenopus tropicalis]
MTDQLKEETCALLGEYLQHCASPQDEKALSPAVQTLHRVVQELLEPNRSPIESRCDQITAEPGTILRTVAEQLPLDGGLNCGRAVALIGFAGFLTQQRGERKAGTPKELAEVLTHFLAVEHKDWLQDIGGWDGFCKYFDKKRTPQAQESSTISNALMAAAGFGLAGLAFIMAVR